MGFGSPMASTAKLTSFVSDDGWNDAPNSPLLLKTPSRTVSNTSVNRPSNQRLFQVVHDFMADAEGELTVWAGESVTHLVQFTESVPFL